MAQRRGSGEDSIYKDGDRWRGAISLGHRPDGTRQRVKVTGRTRSEVVQKLRDVRKAVESGLPAPDGRLTVGTFLDRWLSVNMPGRVAQSTLDGYEDTVRLHLKPALGACLLTNLSVSDVDALWQDKRDAGYRPNSIRIMRAVLRKAIGQAEREGLVARNVAALSAAPHIDQPEGRSLTIEQARTLLDAVAEHRLGLCIELMLSYGLRRGEALGFRWQDFDPERAILGARQGVKRVKARGEAETKTVITVGTLKTSRSRRDLTLTPHLVDALKRHRAVQAEERIAAGPLWQDWDLIFPSLVGSPHDPDNFSHAFNQICIDAGLGHWHPHELRHSGASLMLAQGTTLHVVSEILGHSSIAITKDIYGHLVEGEKRTAATAMSEALTARPATSP
jgi:integrase